MEWQASQRRTITWMRSYFIYWLSLRCPISFCFLTVGKSNIAELWREGRLEELNKILSPELCRCIKAELLQKQDFVKLHLHSVRRISEEKGQNQPEHERSLPSRTNGSSERCLPLIVQSQYSRWATLQNTLLHFVGKNVKNTINTTISVWILLGWLLNFFPATTVVFVRLIAWQPHCNSREPTQLQE